MEEFIFFLIIIAAVIATLTVKKYDSAVALLLSLGAAALILINGIGKLNEVIVKLYDFTDMSGLFLIPLKALGITLASKIVMNLCDDAGDKLLSFTASFISKISVIVITLPLLEEILRIFENIING